MVEARPLKTRPVVLLKSGKMKSEVEGVKRVKARRTFMGRCRGECMVRNVRGEERGFGRLVSGRMKAKRGRSGIGAGSCVKKIVPCTLIE